MRLVAVTRVMNEDDIIESMARHHAALVDHHVFLDNGSIDRTLGVVFGLVRGAALVMVAYIAAGLLVTPERWPEPVLQARALPYAYQGAAWLVGQLPPQYRPKVPEPPPGRETRSADLLHVPAQGRATAHP